MEILYLVIINNLNCGQTVGVENKVYNQLNSLNNIENVKCSLKVVINNSKPDYNISNNIEYISINENNILLKRKKYFNKLYNKIDFESYDIIYIRYPLADYFFYMFLKKINKINNNIFFEFQSIEDKELFTDINLNKFIKLIVEKLFRKRISDYFSGFVSVTNEINNYKNKIYKNKHNLILGNGISVENIPLRESWNETKKIKLVFVGNISSWHGIDKVILALDKIDFFYKNSNVEINVIGEGKFKDELEKIVFENNLGNHINFHGFIKGNKKFELLSKNDIAIGSLAPERRGLKEGSNLKLREYCAFGIPFIKSDYDNDFDNNQKANFFLNVSKKINKKEITKILDFALEVKGDLEITKYMRDYSHKFLDWKNKMKILSNFFEDSI
jgi:glycosyltransferase involved in cell wall biosynthesis